MREIQVIIRTPPGTRPVAVDPTDERQRWRCLAGATAFVADLDAHDGDDPALLAGFLAHWLRPGEVGTRHELAAAGVEERVSTTRTITCARCGAVLHEETIAASLITNTAPDWGTHGGVLAGCLPSFGFPCVLVASPVSCLLPAVPAPRPSRAGRDRRAPEGVSRTVRQLPSSWRRTTSAVVPPSRTAAPSGPVPARVHVERSNARSPVWTTCCTASSTRGLRARNPWMSSRIAATTRIIHHDHLPYDQAEAHNAEGWDLEGGRRHTLTADRAARRSGRPPPTEG